MKPAMRMFILWTAVLGLALGAVALAVAPGIVEARFNRVLPHPRTRVSARARELHGKLRIADRHADTLLWGRDVLARASRGQVDVPRLVEGNVALQAFTVVTQTPRPSVPRSLRHGPPRQLP